MLKKSEPSDFVQQSFLLAERTLPNPGLCGEPILLYDH
jgi:hypothetical protein